MNYPSLKKLVAGVSASAIALTSVMSFGVAQATAATSFTDNAGISSWAADSVSALVDAGVLSGRADGSFDPQGALNRAEMAKVAVLGADLDVDTTGAPHFNDVAPSDWFYSFVETLYNNGVVGGVNGGALDANGLATYNPGGTLNRAEAAKILVEAYDLETAYAGTPPNFPDVASSAWFYDYAETAYAHGILGGYSDGRFGPGDNVTREQVAVIAQSGREQAGLVAGVDAGSKTRANVTFGAASSFVADSGDNDDSSSDDSSNDDDDSTPVVNTGDGVLSISLSAETPESATVPRGAVVDFAAFDLTASGDDVVVTSIVLTRSGVGDEDNLGDFVIRDSDGKRLTQTNDFNSDDEATLNFLGGGLEIDAGSTTTIVVAGETNTADAASGTQHRVSISAVEMISSNAQSVSGSFPVRGETIEIGSQAAATLTIDDDGTPADVKVGETGVDVARFEIDVDNTEDVEILGITLEQEGGANTVDALANLQLEVNGDIVADGVINGDFVSFMLDTAYEIPEGQSRSFTVIADIIGEPTETLVFVIDDEVDVTARGLDFGYGANINIANYSVVGNGATEVDDFTIDAGEITLIKKEPNDKIRTDKDDVVIGAFDVVVASGETIEFEEFRVDVTIADTGSKLGTDVNVSDVLEEVQLRNVTNGSTVTLDLTTDSAFANTADSKTVEYTDDSLGFFLASGTTTEFQIIADTGDKDSATPTPADLVFDGVTFDVSISDIGNTSAGGMVFKETSDDENVDDVTPSTISYNTIDGEDSAASFSVVSQSNVSEVVGTEGVDVFTFEIEESDGVSDLLLRDITMLGSVSSGTFDNTLISQVALYQVDGSTETLLRTRSGSQIAAGSPTTTGTIQLDNVDLTIPADSKVRLRVRADLVDDDANNGKTITFRVDSYDMDDDDNDTVFFSEDTNNGDVSGDGDFLSNRTLTVAGTGILFVAADNTDVEVDEDVYGMAGTMSPFFASYELRTDNEDVEIEDMTLTFTGLDNEPATATVDTDLVVTAQTPGVSGDGAAGDAGDNGLEIVVVVGASDNLGDAASVTITADADNTITATIDNDSNASAETVSRAGLAACINSAFTNANLTDGGTTYTGAEAGDGDINCVITNDVTGLVRASSSASTTDAGNVGETALTGGAATTLSTIVDRVVIYGDDKTTVLADETVTGSSATVEFENVNILAEESASNIYVALELSPYGKDETGVLGVNALTATMAVTDARGASSSNDMSPTDGADAGADSNFDSGEIYYEDDTVGSAGARLSATSASNSLGVVATQITSVEIVDSFGGESIDSSRDLVTGENTLGIIKVTTTSTTNDEDNGEEIKTFIDTVRVNLDIVAADVQASTVTLERVNGNGNAVSGIDVSQSLDDTFWEFDLTASAFGDDEEIDAGTSYYYVVKASITNAGDSGDSVRMDLDDLDGSVGSTANIEFRDSTDATVVRGDLRLETDSLDGTRLTSDV